MWQDLVRTKAPTWQGFLATFSAYINNLAVGTSPLMATFSNRSAAKETFARMALLELAAEFCAKAQQLELRERRANTRQRFSSAIVRTRP